MGRKKFDAPEEPVAGTPELADFADRMITQKVFNLAGCSAHAGA